MLNLFVILTFLGNLFLGCFVLYKGKSSSLNKTFAIVSFSVAFWNFSAFMFWASNVPLFWGKMMFVGPIILAGSFAYFIHIFPPSNPPLSLVQKVLFLIPIIFFLFNVPTNFIVREIISPNREVIYGIGNALFGVYFLLYMGYAFYMLIIKRMNAAGINRLQMNYLLTGTFITTIAGVVTNLILPLLGTSQFNRLGPSMTIVFIGFTAYAIVRHRLMDIRLVITRAVIFILIYALILGFPFWVGFQLLVKPGPWLIPMAMLAWFALAGPFIYFYIQKRAEDRLLKEQKSYQATLRRASAGMGRIKELRKLLNLIVFILTRAVRLEHTVIYIYDEIRKEYRLGAVKRRSSKVSFLEQLPLQSVLIDYLNENHNPIVFEEIKQKAQDYRDDKLGSVQNVIEQLHAALVVPIYIQNRLFAFVAMGKKESGKLFTEDDLGVFTILANQAALAIENAKFYEDMKITQQQLFQAEKMATIGTMADGLSHQINNRFHALGFIAGDALDTINITKKLDMSDKLRGVFQDLEKAFNRVQDNVVQGGEVVQGLLKYSRKGQEGFVPIDVDAVISNAYEMAQFKIKTSQMSLVRKYDLASLPKVKGNFTQLQEVFFNLIDNAYDAMMQRKTELAEAGFHPTLNIYAQVQGENLEMIFEDNGIGVKDEDNTKLFTPFFTTKLSSKKGTGLGLYVIRKIIEDNHKGRVEFISKYKQGTQMKILLPMSSLS